MSGPPPDAPAQPMEQQEPPEETPTFSKVVATCLHELQNFSDVWFPLTNSNSDETPYTLAGMCLKSLLNNALEDPRIMEKVLEIVDENEAIPYCQTTYLEKYPELLRNTWQVQIPLPIQGILGIDILGNKGRIIVKGHVLAEFPVGFDFQWVLYYARYAMELGLIDFRVSVLAGNRQYREYMLNRFLSLFNQTPKSINGTCDLRCYRESCFHFNDHKGNNAFYKLRRCHITEHSRYQTQMIPEPTNDFQFALRARIPRPHRNNHNNRLINRRRIRQRHAQMERHQYPFWEAFERQHFLRHAEQHREEQAEQIRPNVEEPQDPDIQFLGVVENLMPPIGEQQRNIIERGPEAVSRERPAIPVIQLD